MKAAELQGRGVAELLTTDQNRSPVFASSAWHGVSSSRETQFWVLQFAGWLGISLISYVSLNLWYNQPQLSYVLHNVAQSLLGIVLSWPLRLVFRSYWSASWASRAAVISVSVLVFALTWAVIRLATFQAMTGEEGLWADFGGWYFPSIFIFGCWAAFYHGIKYYQLLQAERDQLLAAEATQKEEVLRRISAEAAVKEGQLTLLRYQLNPHFLFNTLNSIYALIDQGAGERASAMLLNLSQFLRYSLEHSADRSVSLAEELNAAKLYLAIEQVRFSDRLTVDFDVDETVSRALVPSFLLQPLIENAIKHAIAQAEQGGSIRIGGCAVAGRLRLTVEDSGPDHSPEHRNAAVGSSVGLKNVRERIATLFGHRGEVLLGESELGGFRVDLSFPLALGESGDFDD
jgi:two-component system LytT family sensor kinase